MYQNPPLPDDWITVDMSAEVLDTIIVHVFRGYSEQSKPATVHNQAKAEMTKERKRANTRRETVSVMSIYRFLRNSHQRIISSFSDGG